MIDASSIHGMIESTLSAMTTSYKPTGALIALIEMTFLEQSDMSRMIAYPPARHGLAQMSREEMESIIRNVIRPNKRNSDNISDVALINVYEDDMDDIFYACSYNIAFQIMLVYYFYVNAMSDLPETIDQAAAAYHNYYKGNLKMGKSTKEQTLKKYIGFKKLINQE